MKKSFPGVKEERRAGERGRRLLDKSNSGDSITEGRVVDRSCRKGNVEERQRESEDFCEKGMGAVGRWGVYICISTPRCRRIFIYAAEKAHVYTKVCLNPLWIVKNLSCITPLRPN